MSTECCAVEKKTPLILPLAAGILLAAGFITETGFLTETLSTKTIDPKTLSRVLYALAVLAGAYTFTPGALKALAKGKLGVGLLMTVSATGSILLGHIGEAAALAFLYSLAETLEERAMHKAKGSLSGLLELLPENAIVRRNGSNIRIKAEKIVPGDILLVAAGEKISTDCQVLEGESSLNQAAITGEAMPVRVVPGDNVIAGGINLSGPLTLKAKTSGTNNTLTQLVQLVTDAQAKKGRAARLADRIAKPLVPAVFIVAALTAIAGFFTAEPAVWIERALVVLVAASPCALAIAVPVTVISAIAGGSKTGLIIKSGAAFERLGTIREIAFDKTGTLTRGEPSVTEVVLQQNFSRCEFFCFAAALEQTSSHPLAKTIVESASREGCEPALATKLVESAGSGIAGVVDGVYTRLGSPGFVSPGPFGADCERMQSAGMTIVVVEAGGVVRGLLGIRDEARREAASAVRMLRGQGISCTILSGDNELAVASLAESIGVEARFGGLLPAQKADWVAGRVSQGACVAMVGDGINDAPALAVASVGIAMGATGTKAAVQAADVAFVGSDLRLLAQGLWHARRGRRIMLANTGIALALIAVLFPLALTGLLGLWQVVLFHELAEVVVIVNGVRAARRPRSLAAEV